MKYFDIAPLIVLLAFLALVPLLVVTCTAFMKIAAVLLIVRNALGIQQVPPTIAVYSLAMVATLYVMAPVLETAQKEFNPERVASAPAGELMNAAARAAEPFRDFLFRHSKQSHRQFFKESAKKLWTPEMAAQATERDFLILMPAFVVSELTSAFEIGFILYLPFIVIDLVVSNVLLALGMMMMSPMTISLPLKLLLFVAIDGWTRLIQGLVLGYA